VVDDRQLIARVLSGGASARQEGEPRGEHARERELAERELFDRHVDRIHRLTYRLAGDADLAQDFTQETFIRAFERLAEFRGDASFATWLHAIAVSVTLNGLRRARRHGAREVALDEAAEVGRTPREAEPDLKARLTRAIDGLPEIHRTVFIMHDMEGYTHEEIGRVLGIPTGTSKARLSYARRALREALADFAGEWVS
jgi:RNA polymerase sigma-70 factor, ECF subfamily